MSEEDGQQEPSMEEILASIRKIISEDDDQEPIQDAAPSGEDMDTVEEISEVEPEVEPEPEFAEEEDELELIDEIEDETELVLVDDEEGLAADHPIPGIVSNPTAQAGTDAFGQLAGIIAGRMQLGQGRTVEELVQELLRPLLREWLDNNLPELVDELVKKEIERMVERANR